MEYHNYDEATSIMPSGVEKLDDMREITELDAPDDKSVKS